MKYAGFLGGTARSQSVIANPERTVNLYVEPIPTEGPASKAALYPTPGLMPFLTVTDLGGRAGLKVNDRAFAVVGGALWELFANATSTKRGTVAQDSNLAQIVYNGQTGNQLLIASGTNAYCYDLTTNTLTQVATLNGEAFQIGMLDGYFLAFNPTLSKVRISNLSDGLTWNVLQFAIRTAQPDKWQGMIVNAPDIWLFGADTSDVWYDAGASPFPLAPRQGLSIPFGIVAPFSLAVTSGSIFWLTQNKDGVGMVVQTKGYSPQRISTAALETAIAGYQRTAIITDAEALVYQKAGHTFYSLRFPRANATWVFDVTTGIWAERGTWNSVQGEYDAWAPRVCLQAFGQHLVGDATGTISTMDETFGSENGRAIRRLRRGPILVNELKRIPIHRFEVLLEQGLGLQTGQGSDPQIMFRGSPDGKTWSNERQMGAGAAGKYQKRAFVLNLGSPRLWVPEISMTDPIPWRISEAYLNNVSAA